VAVSSERRAHYCSRFNCSPKAFHYVSYCRFSRPKEKVIYVIVTLLSDGIRYCLPQHLEQPLLFVERQKGLAERWLATENNIKFSLRSVLTNPPFLLETTITSYRFLEISKFARKRMENIEFHKVPSLRLQKISVNFAKNQTLQLSCCNCGAFNSPSSWF
jgi:hypothetical protein